MPLSAQQFTHTSERRTVLDNLKMLSQNNFDYYDQYYTLMIIEYCGGFFMLYI